MRWLASLVCLLFIFLAPSAQSAALGQAETWRVATRIVKPFVMDDGGTLSGFSIDLWQEISQQVNVSTQYVVLPTVRDLLDAVSSNQVDLAIAAISITEERDRLGDFSQPMFDAGLQILIPKQPSGGNVLSAIFNPSFLFALAFVLIGTVVAGHLIWLLERRRPDGLLESSGYYPGIFTACWWAAATLATQAEQHPRSPAARVVAVIWMFTAVIYVAYFTAAVTSSLTVQQLKADIQGPDDLPGKRVVTVASSTSARFLTDNRIRATEFPSVDEAIDSMVHGDADAVVYDAPVLQYYAAHEGAGQAQVVGSVFRKESYGIYFPLGSPKRKQVDEVLLRLRENGTYDRLVTKWFGTPSSSAQN